MMFSDTAVTNDGKHKHQSFEARVTFDLPAKQGGWISGFEIVGLGATEQEARNNLNEMVEVLKKQIS
jgi:hypothetical protein